MCGNVEGHPVPVLASGEQAERFTRHTMDIVMLYENTQQDEVWMDIAENCSILAGDDLPRFCHTTLVANRVWTLRLEDLTLAIEIYPQDSATSVLQFEEDETSKDGRRVVRDNVLTENSAIRNETRFYGRLASKEKASSEESTITRDHAIVLTQRRVNTSPSPHILRLLEPLSMLHSLHSVYIEGEMSDEYKKSLLLSMLGPPPSDLEDFDLLFGMFEDSMGTCNTSTRGAAITKMISTLDAINDLNKIRHRDWLGTTVIPNGRYVGYTVQDAQEDIQYLVRTKLARAFLDNGNAFIAECYVRFITGEPLKDGSYWTSPPMGHQVAMIFHLEAQIKVALGDIDSQTRVHYLEAIIHTLREGLRHEPGNLILERELKEKNDELDFMREMKELMRLWECLNIKDDVWDADGWGFHQSPSTW